MNKEIKSIKKTVEKNSSMIENCVKMVGVNSKKIESLSKTIKSNVRKIDCNSKKIDRNAEKIDRNAEMIMENTRMTARNFSVIQEMHEKFATKKDVEIGTNRILVVLDGIVASQKRCELARFATRSRYDRLEGRVEVLEEKVG